MDVTASYRAWPKHLAVLKISKVPFWIIWITPIIFAYVESSQVSSAHHIGWFVFALSATCLLEAANCIHNELMDQEEDGVNQPHRASLIASVGEPALWKFVLVGYALCFLSLIPLALYVDPVVSALMLFGGLVAPLYNWGPRLKRRPGLAEVSIGWAAFFGFLWGWSWNAPLTSAPPVVWILAYFFAITSLVKDLPDARGDAYVHAPGVFSVTTVIVRKALLTFIYVSPYLLLGAFVALGLLPVRLLALGVLLFLGLFTFVLGERAQSIHTGIVVYELAFTYVHLFFLGLFVLYTPSGMAVLIAVLLFAARALSLYLGLAPRFVETDFSWSCSILTLLQRSDKCTTSS